jgi:hypothetical protein
MTRIVAMMALLTLAACGADTAPTVGEPGVTVSGEAQVGVVVNPAMVEGQ